jgi:hypothetical protein
VKLYEMHALLPGAQRIGRTGFRAPCPAHGGKSATLSVSEGHDGRLLLKCFAECSTNDVLTAMGLQVRDLFDTDAPPAVRAPRAAPMQELEQTDDGRRKVRLASELWGAARHLTRGPGVDYLLGRSCRIPPADGDMRWLPEASLFGFTGSALVGRITRATDAREAIGLHLTWLKRDGDSWRRTERRYLGGKKGGVVRLWPDEAVNVGLGIAEGIETALAAAHVFQPVWACMDAGNLTEFPLLAGIEALTIFADNDESGTGQRAADTVAHRWATAGREARMVLAERVGSDILDEVVK